MKQPELQVNCDSADQKEVVVRVWRQQCRHIGTHWHSTKLQADAALNETDRKEGCCTFTEFIEHSAYKKMHEQWKVKWEQALDSRDPLLAEIEKLEAELKQLRENDAQ